MSVKDALAAMNDSWTSGKRTANGIPDGIYIMRLEKAELTVSKNGNPMIRREHIVLDGEFAGDTVRDNLVLASDIGSRMVVEWIERVGYEAPSDPTDLPEIIETIQAEGPTVKAKTKKNGSFVNVTVYGLDDGGVDEGAATPEPEPEEKPKKAKTKPKSKAKAKDEGPTLEDLMAFCAKNAVEGVDDTKSREEVIEAINEYTYPKKEATAEEVKLLTAIGATFED